MAKVFISYRRVDSAYAAHAIYDKLVARYGAESVMFDVDTIPLGVDFAEYLNDQVSQCDVLLAIIGDGWLGAAAEDGSRRLDDPDDYVRIEIQSALERNIPVIPVLTGRVSMPKRDALPECLQALTRLNAAEVRSGRDFQSHLCLLVRGLDRLFEQTSESALEPTKPTVAGQKPIDTPPPPEVKTDGVITNSIGMSLRLLPAGKFVMGSASDDTVARDDEKPQHEVRITKPCYFGVYLVTQDDYERVTSNTPSKSKGQPRRPVNKVNWYDTVKFCNQLSEQEELSQYYKIDGKAVSVLGGTGYRLPTEAEWEYACRAGTTSRWFCGDVELELAAVAWYSENSSGGTFSVGEKEPNPWGLYDMHGNVSEWCWDWYGDYQDTTTNDPSGPSSGNRRVVRGGAFSSEGDLCRSATRSGLGPGYRVSYVGFRVSRTYS